MECSSNSTNTMKKKSASKSAFFNLRVLIGLCIALAGISLALVGLDAFAVNSAPVKIRNHIITASNDPLVPVGFDCSKIEELGINKMENFRAGAIMIACGADETSGFSSVSAFFQRIGQGVKKLLVPLYGAGDVDLITHPETSPNIVQSETYTTVNPDNPQQVVVAFNDSRGRNASPINISGASVSTDGGATFDRLTCTAIQTGVRNRSKSLLQYDRRSRYSLQQAKSDLVYGLDWRWRLRWWARRIQVHHAIDPE